LAIKEEEVRRVSGEQKRKRIGDGADEVRQIGLETMEFCGDVMFNKSWWFCMRESDRFRVIIIKSCESTENNIK